MTIFGSDRPSRRAVLGTAAGATIIAAASRFPRRARAQTPTKITLGYQSLWAAQGEIFETLRHTNILALYGFDAQFKTFSFGPPLVEAAVAGDVDNLIAADIPVLRGAAKLTGTKVLARTHDWRWGIVAQPDFQGASPISRASAFPAPSARRCFRARSRRLSPPASPIPSATSPSSTRTSPSRWRRCNPSRSMR